MKVIKRNGVEVEFDIDKVSRAMTLARDEVGYTRLDNKMIKALANEIEAKCESYGRAVSVEEIQDMVEDKLMQYNAYSVARAYIRYRYDREKLRQKNTTDDAILSLIELDNEDVKQENSNKNPYILPTQRDYMAGEVSKDLCHRKLVPKHIMKAHDEGIIHFHDSDYFAQHMHNCCLVNLEDMLQNGTVISGTMIEKPKMFSTACNIGTQIIAQVASSQYGGQSITLAHLAPFVQDTREKFIRKFKFLRSKMTEEEFNQFIEDRVYDDIEKGVQTIQYQIVTLMTTNGQTPFITVFMNINEVSDGQARKDLAVIIEEVLKQRMQGVKNEVGEWITPAFPKLIYLLDENNAYPGTEYFYLTELAARCTAKRMVPDYISAKKMREYKVDKSGVGRVYTCMGCRSFLTPYLDESGKPKFYGRFNQGVVTINLPDVALSAGKQLSTENQNKVSDSEEYKQKREEYFWRIFDERLELCYEALMVRHRRLEGTISDVAPIIWQYGALARLKKGEKIDKLLHGGYSTISLGYAGLHECVKYMTGSTHTKEPGTSFAIRVMQHMNDKCAEWKAKENIDFSLYGTPIESTTYKFAKALQRRFGVIKGINDKGYITNSYHVHVTEEIDAFKKLSFEAQFQKLSPGGAISYVEVPNMMNNIEAVLAVIQYIYENTIYGELNTRQDYCQVCGFEGEIKIVKDNDKLVWECPNCGNRDQRKMNVPRRTCGYIGTQFWNQGRTQEINERVLHL